MDQSQSQQIDIDYNLIPELQEMEDCIDWGLP